MGPQLVQWFLFSLAISVFAAYMTSRAVGPGGRRTSVVPVRRDVAFLAYSLGRTGRVDLVQEVSARRSESIFDGLVYGLFTAGAFGWLWPKM